MTDEELKQRIANGEDGWTERKSKGVSTEDIARTIIAFANSLPDGHRAVLFIGVSDKGVIEGVDDTNGLQKRVRYAAEEKCYPPILLNHNCRGMRIEGKDVVAVIVEASHNRPHFAGPSFVRIGSETVAATTKQLEQLIASRLSKARPLLEAMREKMQVVVSHWTHGRENKLIGATPLGNCNIVECTSQFVTFQPANEAPVSREYERISITRDISTGRLRVDIDG